MLNLLFVLATLIPIPFWLAMVVAPHREFTNRLLKSHLALIALGTIYLLLAVGSVLSSIGQVSLGNLFSLEGLPVVFSRTPFALTVWVHLLCMDLAGCYWVYHEAPKSDMPNSVLRLCLILTFLLAPFGILCFVIWRVLRSAQHAAALNTDTLTDRKSVV